jgi:hypothetical protein
MENKCEQLNMHHAWKDITEYGFVYPTYPPQYPPKKRECLNCGKIETLVTIQSKEEIQEWQ